ncbi:unnamed protein product [Prorocentrum cordatum]|uniref:Uncharacterized protein n=1 Tax=Prorocentrum cordatum TaxID=2364126 RepID=A0ABN9T062_9DINO|nr:unnamed protein product [Polarella glacialis]
MVRPLAHAAPSEVRQGSAEPTRRDTNLLSFDVAMVVDLPAWSRPHGGSRAEAPRRVARVIVQPGGGRRRRGDSREFSSQTGPESPRGSLRSKGGCWATSRPAPSARPLLDPGPPSLLESQA